MKRVFYRIMLVVGIVVLFAIGRAAMSPSLLPNLQATAESLLASPQPAAYFVSFLYPYPGSTGRFSDAICLRFSPETLYQPGDYKRDFDKVWPSLYTLTIDGRTIPFGQGKLIRLLGCHHFEGSDDRCAIINVYGCMEKVGITKGLHLAKFEARTLSGNVYTYLWAFRADDVVDSMEPARTAQGNDSNGIAVDRDPYTVRNATLMAPLLHPTPTPTPVPRQP